MKCAIVLNILLSFASCLTAQNYKALIIGIDKYAPPAGIKIPAEASRAFWPDLEGSKNDALAMKSILEVKYGFKSTDIIELYNSQATRNAILKALDVLLHNCRTGDIAFIYYAGHGSQQKNSKSIEADKKDESIVPYDTWRKGVGDIRDKEQAQVYNAFLDKGVKLTVIMDCCHSGSMSRGEMLYQIPKYRYMPGNDYDANDGSNPVAPATRNGSNFLMISASQDNELAQEQVDDNKITHGAFTLALMQALNQQPIDASMSNLFTSIRAILKSNGKKQEPQLAGNAERMKQTLLGVAKGSLSDKILVPVSEIQNGKVEFLGGFAVGLNKENELTMVNDPSIVVRLDTVIGVTRSSGKILKGKLSGIKPGSLFEVTNWVSPSAPMLKIFIPPTDFSYADIMKLATLCKEIKISGKTRWVSDLEKYQPDINLWYTGDKMNANVDGTLHDDLKATSLSELISLASGKSVFFNLPSDKDLVIALKKRFRSNKNISLVTNALEASYMLYGTINDDGLPSYGLLNCQASLKDTIESMPLQTSHFALAGNNEEIRQELADSIYEHAARLAKVRAWLNLAGPKNKNFPFHLSIMNETTKQEVDSKGYKIGDIASLHLVANSNYAQLSIPVKYIYVFIIDRNGNMQLIFGGNNDDNRIPAYEGNKLVTDKILISEYEVSEPAGTDNIFLLATDEQINNAEDFLTQEGVKRRGTGYAGPLEILMNPGNDGSRGFGKTPANWNLLRLAVKTSH